MKEAFRFFDQEKNPEDTTEIFQNENEFTMIVKVKLESPARNIEVMRAKLIE